MDMTDKAAAPKPTLSVVDTVALIVGIVMGAGIFKTPSLVAANAGSDVAFLLTWLAGGAIALIGALCYAELATAYPHAGGDYHYLTRAFGRDVAFLFAWARMMVIQTGSIVTVAFVFGDYVAELTPIGKHAPFIYAALAIVLTTALNVAGVQQGKWTQNVLTAAKVVGLLSVVVAGLVFVTAHQQQAGRDAPPLPPKSPLMGLAMIFVLYAYGGWNEAAYVSAELRDVRRNMTRALLYGIGIITAIYLLANFAYLKGLGLTGMSQSQAVAADLMRRVMGEGGAKFVSLLIAVSALGGVNATVFTGARTNYAMGQDFALFGFLGRWNERANTPTRALLTQGVIALALVLFGAFTREGFSTMVDYITPVFWFFFLLAGLSLFVLRTKEPEVARPFRVPLYPLVPLLFCMTCVYMLQSSLAYAGIGALVGVAVLMVGMPLLLWARRLDDVKNA
jgi:amino acid transporter